MIRGLPAILLVFLAILGIASSSSPSHAAGVPSESGSNLALQPTPPRPFSATIACNQVNPGQCTGSTTVTGAAAWLIKKVSGFCSYNSATAPIFEAYIETFVNGGATVEFTPIPLTASANSLQFNDPTELYADAGSTISYNAFTTQGFTPGITCTVYLQGWVLSAGTVVVQ